VSMTFIRANITIRKNVPFKVLLQYANEPPEPADDEDIKLIAALAPQDDQVDAAAKLWAIRLILADILGTLPDGSVRPPRTFEGQVVGPGAWDKVNELLPR